VAHLHGGLDLLGEGQIWVAAPHVWQQQHKQRAGEAAADED
jgi:hypothetical protein